MLIVRRHTPLSLIVLILAAGLFASAAAAAPTRPSSGALSHRLALVAKPTFAESSPRSQANELGLPVRGAGSLLRLGNRYVADVRTAAPTGATARRLDRLAGVSVLGRSSRYRAVTVAASASSLHSLAHQPRVAAVTEELTPMVSGAGPGTSAVCQGSVTSEGLTQLHADQVQNTLGDTGAGVTVGVLSDSFDRNTTAATHAANDVASGDLPGSGNPCGRSTPVNVLDDSDSSGKDEGRGMLQVVHDLAPDAKLAFATAFSGELNFANNIRALATAGAKVITDDVTYFDEPFFQDGPVAVAVNDVTAGGATYFSSAANNNLIDSSGRNIASWETPSFRDSGSCPAGLPGYAQHCLDFDPGPGVDNTFGITVDPGATLRVDLQWAQPWNGVATDLDAYLVGTSIKSENANLSTQKPFEFLAGTNTGSTPITVNLAINRCDTTCNPTNGGDSGTPRVKFALVQNGGGVSSTEYPTSSGGDTVGPTIFGHNGAANAMSTAAVPYNNSNTVEPYSSRGPLTQYFGPVNGTTPAPPISPTTLDKPDIAATDCAATTFFGSLSGGVWRFCGTSEAAPHAAAVAALELSANPALSVAQVKAAQTSTAAPVGSFDHTAVGAGLVNAFAAVSSVAPTDTTPPNSMITSGPSGFTRDATPTFAFRSSEPGSTFQCRLDARAWAACTSPKTTAKLTQGPHTFFVRAADKAKNVDPTPAKRSFTVDTAPPNTTITAGPSGLINDATPTFSFGSTESGSSFQCKVDGAAYASCSSPKTTAALTKGAHTFFVRAADKAKNVDPTPAKRSFTVDTAPPNTTITAGPSGLINDATPTFSFGSTESGSSFQCKVDGAAYASCSSPKTTAALTKGAHTFFVRAADKAKNVDPTPAKRSFTVDTAAPNTKIKDGPAEKTKKHSATFKFKSTESGSTFKCKLDDGKFKACESPKTYRHLERGKHSFKVKATDKAGNVDSTAAKESWRIKKKR